MTLDKRVFALAPLIAAGALTGDVHNEPARDAEAVLQRYESIAQAPSVNIQDILESIDVAEDGTGSYRLTSPVAFVQYSALNNVWNNGQQDVDDLTNERSFYEAADAPEFYRGRVESVGYSPLDAIEALITSASEAAHVDVNKGLQRNDDAKTVEERISAIAYASGVDFDTITVDTLTLDGTPIGYRAWANATVYGRGE